MMNRLLMTVLALSGLALAATPLIAHHSFAAQYDRAKQATLTGPVVRVDWINPHARFFLEVKDTAGKTTRWEVELSAPAMLMRRGWTSTYLKVGEEITVNGSLAKDGSNMINASTVKLSNGKQVFAGSSGDADSPTP